MRPTPASHLLAVDHGLTTLRKTRVVGQHQQIVRLDYEEIHPLAPSVESEILKLFEACVDTCDIVVISDYAKGFLSLSLSQTIIRRAHEVGLDVIVDPRPQNRECYRGCDYLTPNWKESRALLRLPDARRRVGRRRRRGRSRRSRPSSARTSC